MSAGMDCVTESLGTAAVPVERAWRAWLRRIGFGLGLLGALSCTGVASASDPTVLYTFTGVSDGGNPLVGLVQGPDGNFYGSTSQYGANSAGTVFRITPTGTFTLLDALSTSTFDTLSTFILGSDGNLYSAAAGGGPECSISAPVTLCGAIVKMTLDGTMSVLYQFADATLGSAPNSLIQGSDGNFYGTTSSGGDAACNPGGDPPGCGIVFKLTPAGVLTVLYSFTGGADSSDPDSLIQGSDGNFYGTTGQYDPGETIFSLTPAGVFTTLYSFTSGYIPGGPLVQASDGNFYGTTETGGSSSSGTIFRITPEGTFTSLYSFGGTDTDPGYPSGPLLVGSDGNLYGTASGELDSDDTVGSVFSISPSGSYSVLALFADPNPSGPVGGVVEDSSGNLYGVLNTGGPDSEAGGVFTLSGVVGAAMPTVTLSAAPTSITQGQSLTLTWSSTNASACTAGGAWSGSQATSGSQVVTPTGSGSLAYTLSCSGAGGSANATAEVSVAAAAPTVTLSASSSTIALGQSTTLTWSSTNATACSASNAWSGSPGISGSQVETPTAIGAVVYTLSCSGPGGATDASATVEVTAITTTLSGKAGGAGGMGPGTLLGLGLLVLARLRRRFRYAATCALLLGSAPVFAQQAGFDLSRAYVGLRAGVGTYEVDPGDLNAVISADDASVTSMQQRQFAGVLYGGLPFYRWLSLELGFADLGIYHVGLSAPTADVAPVAAEVLDRLEPAGRGITLGLGGHFDLGSVLALEPHLGILGYQSRQEVLAPGARYTRGNYGVALDAGATLLFRLSHRFYLGPGYECLNGCDVRLISAELEFRPGH